MFRFPPQRNLFCAFVGTGTQLLGLAVAIFGLACMNLFYPYNRWALALSRKAGSDAACCTCCISGGNLSAPSLCTGFGTILPWEAGCRAAVLATSCSC